MLMTLLGNVPFVLTNVTLVPLLLITVLNVSHLELLLQLVHVLMDLMITVTLVLLVPITVPPVTTEKPVKLVQSEDKWLVTNVNVSMVSMILVKLNVELVDLNVLLVIEITTVSLVTIHHSELFLIVNVQLVGKMLLTVLIVLKSHLLMDSTN